MILCIYILKILIKENTNITKLKDIAERFAGKIRKGNVVLFEGELGAGKTTFTRFLINSIFEKEFLKKPYSIKSPSFPIMISYQLKNFQIFHYDFYRLENNNELAELNIFENIKNNISIIEWPKKLIKYKDIENYYLIKIKILNSFMRAIEISNSNKKIF